MYILWGFGLSIAKFAIDTAVVRAFTGKTWTPVAYLVPSVLLRDQAFNTTSVPTAFHLTLAALTLPFLWVGLSMSVRRAADAGLSPWYGTLFLVPVFNYLTMLVLSILPTKASARWNPPPSPYRGKPGDAPDSEPLSTPPIAPSVQTSILAVGAGLAVGLPMVWISVYGFASYGAVLFFATPFAMGAASATVANARETTSRKRSVGLALLGTLFTGLALSLFGVEGLICLAMAMPFACLLSFLGALVGWSIVQSARRPRQTMAMIAVLPLLAFGEARTAVPTMRQVTTAIEIDAPPSKVWTNVVGFSELPPPQGLAELPFELGVAYPMRAKIAGTGVGAIRRCEFSTGAFVEPIQVWDEPNRLAFDVTQQPPAMHELSFWKNVQTLHLQGYMVSHGGEFRLIALPHDRTRLEGTTHYTLDVFPELYWTPWAEVLLHAIHHRVLLHVKHLSEGETALASAAATN
jgi:uncharacterized membrane protein YhaH (DUF805 family)